MMNSTPTTMNWVSLLICCCCVSFVACNSASPEKYFDTAVLNSNMLSGFASEGLERELASPSLKLVNAATNETAPMKRKDIIDGKIQYLEDNFKQLQELNEKPDTKDMLQAAIALNAYVLPVYKNEYRQLAKLYDDGAPKEQVLALQQRIHDKYYLQFDKLFKTLVGFGKPYAAEHNIKVNWGDL